jgi:hypothetical protein
MHPRLVVSITLCLTLASATASAQYHQTDFPAEEFKSRHASVFEQIGATAVAVIQGVAQTEGYRTGSRQRRFVELLRAPSARRRPQPQPDPGHAVHANGTERHGKAGA